MNAQMSRTLGAVAGAICALLLFASLAAVDPLREATDAELTDWWSSNSNLDDTLISMYTRLFAAPFLLVFLAQLRRVLRTHGDGGWGDLVQSSGVVCAAMLALSALARGVTAQSVRFNDEPLPGVDTLRFVTELSIQAYAMAAIGSLAVAVGVTGIIVLRTRALPGWLGWVSLPFAAISLVAVPLQMGAFASPLLLLWLLATSFCLARSKSAEDEVATVTSRSVPQPS